jgi:SEC-C motif
MGAIAEGIFAYAQPLIDQTDGSLEQVKQAMSLSQYCWNLSLVSEDRRSRVLAGTQQSLQMDDDEFKQFRSSIVITMMERHKVMFPFMHGPESIFSSRSSPSLRPEPIGETPPRKKRDTDPYEPCPCNSGNKYKFCCRDRDR